MHTVVIVLVFALALLLAWFFLIRKTMPVERFLLIAMAVCGFLYNLVQTPGMVPDEYAHIETAYRYANVLLFKPYATEDDKLLERVEDAPLSRFQEFHTPKASAYAQVREEFRLFCGEGGEKLVAVEGRKVNAGFAAYLCSAVGIALARILHLGTYPMLYLGRLANLCCYVLLVALALRITPIKKVAFALAGFTPMAMQLVGSFSYDAPILGMCMLLTAYELRLVYAGQRVRPRQWLLVCGLAFLLVPCKLLYAVVLALLLFLSPEQTGGRGRKYAWIACVLLSGLIGFIPSNMDTLRMFFNGTGEMISDSNNALGTELYTLYWVLANPGASVQIFLHTIRQNFDFLWTSMLSGRLAVFEPVVNWSLLLLIALVLGAMKAPEDAHQLTKGRRLVCLMCFLAVVAGASVVMLFMYTPFGSEVILGVQGRYFLPVLPLLLLAVGSGQIALTERAQRRIACLSFGLNAAVLAEILLWTLSRV